MESRSFDGVSAATWERMRAAGQAEHGTVIEDAEENRGTATTRTPIGAIAMGFHFDPEAECITYTILKKPFLAVSSLIWGGVAATIERCRRG